MAENTFQLPEDISWKLLATSPDMMDTQFCNKKFPFRWRSSLAISAYEPKPEEIPKSLCEGKITFLKITATITGYQPTREETEDGYVTFPNVPTEEMSRIIDQYFACYGAQIHVAVFPNPNFRFVEENRIINFAAHTPGTNLLNPFNESGASFLANGQSNNRIVDLFPVNGDGNGELDLFNELQITIPPTRKVLARVAYFNNAGVRMEALSNGESIDIQSSSGEPGVIHDLIIEGEDIDQVILRAPENEASLLLFSYIGQTSQPFPIAMYPKIISTEPTKRELLQAATETGEILTTSNSKVTTNKNFTHTQETANNYKLTGNYNWTPKKDEGGPGGAITGEYTHSSKETDSESWTVATDASRERKESQGSSTQISQLYNLLDSYHIDTNRVLYMMLARPHVLQPTDHRTFVDGLRKIEGTQQFFLVVARPPEIKGLSVEVLLETGHFPEGLIAEEPEEEYDEGFEDFRVYASASGGIFFGSCTNIESKPSSTYTIDTSNGWVVDRRLSRNPDPGHLGIKEISENDNLANLVPEGFDYRPISDTTVQVSGKICGSGLGGPGAIFDRVYRVFTRSSTPKPSSSEPSVPLENLLITSRSLCASFLSSEECPVVDSQGIYIPPGSIVAEPEINISSSLLRRSSQSNSKHPIIQEVLNKIHHAMITSGRLMGRRSLDEPIGFLDSDYFKKKVKKALDKSYKEQPIDKFRELNPRVTQKLGKNCTVSEALDLKLDQFMRKTGLSLSEALDARKILMGQINKKKD